jgi:hypothetical protein
MTKKHWERDGRMVCCEAASLKIDKRYQRELDEKRVKQLADPEVWKPEKVRPALVSERANGDRYIMDGQHTNAAGLLRNGEHWQRHCLIFRDLTPQEEAEIFWTQRAGSRALCRLDEYKARLFGKEPTVVAIDAVVMTLGLQVAGYVAADTIAAVNALEKVHYTGNLEATLSVLKDTWGKRGNRASRSSKTREGCGAYSAVLIRSVSLFLKTYSEVLDRDRLVQQLLRYLPTDVETSINSLYNAHGHVGARERHGAQKLQDIYNKGLRKSEHMLEPFVVRNGRK